MRDFHIDVSTLTSKINKNILSVEVHGKCIYLQKMHNISYIGLREQSYTNFRVWESFCVIYYFYLKQIVSYTPFSIKCTNIFKENFSFTLKHNSFVTHTGGYISTSLFFSSLIIIYSFAALGFLALILRKFIAYENKCLFSSSSSF